MITDINKTIIKLQESMEALESRNAFQDDMIEQLNNELAVHQSEISELKSQLTLIANRVKENAPGQSESHVIDYRMF